MRQREKEERSIKYVVTLELLRFFTQISNGTIYIHAGQLFKETHRIILKDRQRLPSTATTTTDDGDDDGAAVRSTVWLVGFFFELRKKVHNRRTKMDVVKMHRRRGPRERSSRRSRIRVARSAKCEREPTRFSRPPGALVSSSSNISGTGLMAILDPRDAVPLLARSLGPHRWSNKRNQL